MHSFEVIGAFHLAHPNKSFMYAILSIDKFEFAIDCRTRFCPPLPKGYHGNAAVSTCAIASAGELTVASYHTQLG
ncbi:hypothetical protein O6H91_09G111300 [Diphasiastrum complanatum]|uniref:Uncharacterized protein n=1 Tax=Diphasiastrum complanatum TaxID=34168 RepID=A0ACC2CTK3_DIPCM|nr:hypothetical protein O6H91_09G111300 [Diphasiastrum complanatum]